MNVFNPVNNYLVRLFRPKGVVAGTEDHKDHDCFTIVIAPENTDGLEPGVLVIGSTEHLRPVELDGCGFFLLPPQDILGIVE